MNGLESQSMSHIEIAGNAEAKTSLLHAASLSALGSLGLRVTKVSISILAIMRGDAVNFLTCVVKGFKVTAS